MLSQSSGGRRRVAVAVLALVVLLAAGPSIAAAQSFQGASDTVVVERGETYDSIEGLAGTIIVRGTVTGDVSTAAGTVHVTESGTVEGDVAAAAGTVRIDGTVGGDVSAAAGTLTVAETGRIGGNLDAGAGYVGLDGAVDGSVRAGAETIVLGPTANIGGDVRYDAQTFTRAPEATVGGQVVRDDTIGQQAGPSFGPVPTWLGALYGLLANLLLGAFLLALFPAFSERVADTVADQPARSGGVGLLVLVLVPVVLVLLAVTIVGIPLSVLGAFVFGVTVWVAVVYGQYAVAAWALGYADTDSRWLALVAGLVAFAILGAVPVLGGLLELIAFLLGLGALSLALRDAYTGRQREETGGRQTTLEESTGDTSTA